MDNTWKADPEKYAEMSKPFESQEEAEKVATEFFNAVRRLREQYRIAELTMQCQIYVNTLDGVVRLISGGGWGDQLEQAKLAKRSADQEFNHLLITIRKLSKAIPQDDGTELASEMLLTMIEQLIEAMPEARKALITDPKYNVVE